MKEIALEDLVTTAIETFLENVRKFGCPDNDVIKWYFSLSEDEKFDLSDKLLEIQEKEYEEWKKENAKED